MVQRKTLEETGAEHFAENLTFPIRHLRDHQSGGIAYPYGFPEIDKSMKPLGIPWESSKDIPFNHAVPFIGFLWDLRERSVSLPEPKKLKYRLAIHEWTQRATHTLDEAQKLYGKLLHTCHIIP